MAALAVPGCRERWEERRDLLLGPPRLAAVQGKHRDAQVLARSQVGEDAPVVRHVADSTAGDLLGRSAGDVASEQTDGAAGKRRRQPGQAPQRGRLADPVASEQRDHLSTRDAEAQLVQHVREPIAGIQSLDLEQRLRRDGGTLRRRGGGGARGLSQVDLADARVLPDLLRSAVCKHLALVQDDDAGGHPEHHVHVVLDQQDGEAAAVGQPPDLRQHAIALARSHPCGGFVEQQQARSGRQRERDLEQSPIAVRQLRRGARRAIREPHVGEHPPRALLHVRHAVQGAQRDQRPAGFRQQRDGHVLLGRELRKDVRHLEGARHPGADAGARR